MKNTRLRTVALSALTGLGFASAGWSQTATIDEPFAQTAGDIEGKPASTAGLTGNWDRTGGTINVVTPDTITHGALANSDGQVDLVTSSGTDGFVATNGDLAAAGLLDDGATLWFSLAFQKTAGGGSNEQAGW